MGSQEQTHTIGPMQARLIAHPSTPSELIDEFEVEVAIEGTRLRLRYAICGRVHDLALPAPTAVERRDGLWQHTCCEVFVRSTGTDGYTELNFSPSSAWAAYEFDGYRTGMRNRELARAPHIELIREPDRLVLSATVDRVAAEAQNVNLALAAVLEDRHHRKSYWALTHPGDKPDFHHPDAFTLAIAPGVSR